AARNGLPSLPAFVGRYRQHQRAFPIGEVRVAARFKSGPHHIIRGDIEFLDDAGGLIARIDSVEFVSDAALVEKFTRRRNPAPTWAPPTSRELQSSALAGCSQARRTCGSSGPTSRRVSTPRVKCLRAAGRSSRPMFSLRTSRPPIKWSPHAAITL